jgi:16S rRNA (guanine966-N2)-methyltransferase
LRVVSGKARGTKLKTIEGNDTRPTSDMVKEAIFSMVRPHIYDSVCLDLFSGSGAIGIEAVSRGAYKAALVEKSKKNESVIKENLTKTRLLDDISLFLYDSSNFIDSRAKSYLKGISREVFDIVFLDPPYFKNLIVPSIESLISRGVVGEETVFVCEHDAGEEMPESIGIYAKIKEKKYGRVKVSIYGSGE